MAGGIVLGGGPDRPGYRLSAIIAFLVLVVCVLFYIVPHVTIYWLLALIAALALAILL